MSQTTDERENDRERLRERARTADDPDDRLDAIRRLAALDRERNRETYESLASE